MEQTAQTVMCSHCRVRMVPVCGTHGRVQSFQCHGGMRCVRVIHGKGLTSPNREPVLKGKVRRWLARGDDVLAYCEAPRHAGGSGAVVVLLRGK